MDELIDVDRIKQFTPELKDKISKVVVKLASPDQFKSDGQNPNIMTEAQLDALEQSFRLFGTLQPIVCDQNMTMIDGEQRLKIYSRIGIDKIPYVQIDVDDAQRRILRQVLNKLKGSHDYELDLAEYQRIIDAGKEIDLKELLAINDRDWSKILDEINNIETTEMKTKPFLCPNCGYDLRSKKNVNEHRDD